MRPVIRIPTRALSTDFLIQVALLGVQRWDRLNAQEQQRFRELAPRIAAQNGSGLTPVERKELGRLWKRLEARALLREAVALLRTKASATPPGAVPAAEEADALSPDGAAPADARQPAGAPRRWRRRSTLGD